MNNYGYQGYQTFQTPYGMYGQPSTVPVMKAFQPLSQEEINHLRTKSNDVTNVSLTAEEILKSKCTHKWKDGRFSLLPLDPNNPGSGDVICEICGAQFNLNPVDEATLTSAIAIVKNTAQQSKTLWPDIPPAVATEYMMIEPLLSKLPNLYKVAADHNQQYSNSINLNPQQMGWANGGFGTGNAFGIFDGYTNNMYPMYSQPPMYYGPQPGYGQQPMQQPNVGQQMYGQPMQPNFGQPAFGQQPMYGQPMPMNGGMGMGGNPFGFETTQPPQATAQVAQPAAPAATQAPAATPAPAAAPAAAPATVEVNKQFSM